MDTQAPPFEMPLFHTLCALAQTGLSVANRERHLSIQVVTENWKPLKAMAERHHILPLVANGVMVCESAVPEWLSSECRQILATTVFRNQYQLEQLAQLEQMFSRHSIPVLSFKGPRFTESYYGSTALRRSVDLDLLTHPSYLMQAHRLLTNHGFSCATHVEPTITRTSHYEAAYTRETPPLMLEMHWALGASCYHMLRMDRIWPQASTIPAPLAAIDLLFYLCGHGLGHRWNTLSYVCDVTAVIQSSDHDINWDNALHLATTNNKRRSILVALALAKVLLNAALPTALLTEIENRKDVQHLVQRIVALLAQNDAKVSNVRVFKMKFDIMQSFDDRLNLCMRTANQCLRPSTTLLAR